MTTFATPETVNPVADQCEVSGVPCLSNDCPLEPYFFGRQGDPKKGFDWTYNYFFSAVNMADAYYDAWDQVPTNKVVGALWPNDNDGQAFSRHLHGKAEKRGYKIVDPGRFDLPVRQLQRPDRGVQVGRRGDHRGRPAAARVHRLHERGGPAEPTAEDHFDGQGDRVSRRRSPRWVLAPRACRSRCGGRRRAPSSPASPESSSQELSDAYEKATGKQTSMTLGFRHALFETAFDALKRTQNLDDPASIRDAIAKMDYASIVGPMNFKQGALSEHFRNAAGDRPVEEGNEVPVRPHRRRQHDRAHGPARRQDDADRLWLTEGSRHPPGKSLRRRSRCWSFAASRGASAACV